MMLPPLTFIENATTVPYLYMYVTVLAAAKEASSLHVTTKCVTNSYTLLYYPSLITIYVENPSSTPQNIRGG